MKKCNEMKRKKNRNIQICVFSVLFISVHNFIQIFS